MFNNGMFDHRMYGSFEYLKKYYLFFKCYKYLNVDKKSNDRRIDIMQMRSLLSAVYVNDVKLVAAILTQLHNLQCLTFIFVNISINYECLLKYYVLFLEFQNVSDI